MKIGVMSDSHGSETAILKAVKAVGEVEVWIHAGDYETDAAFLETSSGVKVVSVAGNCDGFRASKPEEEFLEVCGRQIWICHGHQYGVKNGTGELIWMAKQYGVDAVIYGHTHIPDITKAGTLLVLNPGSAARPRYPYPTCMRLEIEENGELTAKLLKIAL